jgi:hypothetical protein
MERSVAESEREEDEGQRSGPPPQQLYASYGHDAIPQGIVFVEGQVRRHGLSHTWKGERERQKGDRDREKERFKKRVSFPQNFKILSISPSLHPPPSLSPTLSHPTP